MRMVIEAVRVTAAFLRAAAVGVVTVRTAVVGAAVAVAALMLFSRGAGAQYQVLHGSFNSGGGAASGSHYSYHTTGQGPAGAMGDASYAVGSGFWYGAGVSSTVDVTVSFFEGEIAGFAVKLKWDFSAAIVSGGINVYRAEAEAATSHRTLSDDAMDDVAKAGAADDAFARLNGGLLPAGDARSYIDETAVPGRSYLYRIGVVDGERESMSAVIRLSIPPRPMTLFQNYPNPFNPSTTIRCFLPSDGPAKLVIYDVQGRKVAVLLDGWAKAGNLSVVWNGTNDRGNRVASGVYYYRLDAMKKVVTKKLVVLR